jgi:hypothetical protein
MSVQLPYDKPLGPSCYGIELTEKKSDHRITLPRLEKFTERDLLFDGNSKHYKTGFPTVFPTFKEGNGQLSMLLLETYFFCRYIPQDESNVTIVYAGSHPGDHILHLAIWFPNFKFYLYDSNMKDDTLKGPLELRSSIAMEDKDSTEGERTLSERVIFNRMNFAVSVAEDLREKLEKDQANVYFISDIRNPDYKKTNTPERNSSILDCDMRDQLLFAKALNPKFALMRYRPKLENERLTFSDLNDAKDPPDIRKRYFKYPKGRFLKVPMGKREQSSMFIITDYYKETEGKEFVKYQHEDMISMIMHHNYNTRRVATYLNPSTLCYNGFISAPEVLSIANRAGICPMGVLKEPQEIRDLPKDTDIILGLSKYCCSMNWDHRAMMYIIGLYINYTKERVTSNSIKNNIIIPYLSMDLQIDKKKSQLNRYS